MSGSEGHTSVKESIFFSISERLICSSLASSITFEIRNCLARVASISLPSVVKLLLFLRKSLSLPAHTLLPLQSLLRNHATCPWKEQPYSFAASRAQQRCLES